jgi:hypothetical protein
MYHLTGSMLRIPWIFALLSIPRLAPKNNFTQLEKLDDNLFLQWAMVGVMLIIFLLIPETPWWLASKEKLDKAAKVLLKYNGHVEGYNVDEVIVSIYFFSFLFTIRRLSVTIF